MSGLIVSDVSNCAENNYKGHTPSLTYHKDDKHIMFSCLFSLSSPGCTAAHDNCKDHGQEGKCQE